MNKWHYSEKAPYGIYLAIAIFITGIQAFITQQGKGKNGHISINGGEELYQGKNLIKLVIALELLLLAIGLLFAHFGFLFDDIKAASITLYQQPLAGAESAVGQALLIAYYPTRGSLDIVGGL